MESKCDGRCVLHPFSCVSHPTILPGCSVSGNFDPGELEDVIYFGGRGIRNTACRQTWLCFPGHC